MTGSVLVYSMGEVIGDGLIKLPFVAGLRAAFPDARISWCAAKGSSVYAGPLATARAAVPGARFPEAERTDAYADIKGPLLVIALASRLAAGVANDAGPGHMMAAGGAPLLSLQKDRRKAVKFRPAAQRLELLVAEDYGGGMETLPLDSAVHALEGLLA